MTSKERVYAALDGKGVDRVPYHMWLLVWATDHYAKEVAEIGKDFPDDIAYAGCRTEKQSPLCKGDAWTPGEYIDDYGCRYENVQRGIVGEVKRPLVEDEDWEDVENVHIPEEWLTFNVEEVNEGIKSISDKFVIAGHCPRPFERLQFIRGTENFYIDLMMRPAKMMEFMEKLHDFYCRLLTKWAQTDVDALQFMDDWGSQRSLLINPKTWRELFKPMYKDFIDIAHKHGKRIFMHSDGYIVDILPDLIDLGLDAVNSQIFCMGLDQLEQFRGKITFWGEIDRQNLLPYASTEEIRKAVRGVYEKLWDGGHCIAQLEFGPGAKPENVRAAFDEWMKLTRR